MSYTPIVNNESDYNSGSITINYIDPVTHNINTLVYNGVSPKLIQQIHRTLRSSINC